MYSIHSIPFAAVRWVTSSTCVILFSEAVSDLTSFSTSAGEGPAVYATTRTLQKTFAKHEENRIKPVKQGIISPWQHMKKAMSSKST